MRNNLNNKKVFAVCEIGLDYHNVNYNKQQQIEVFEKQIKLANEFGLPVSIHSRESFEDTISVLEKNEYLLKNGGVIHCFSGSPEIAKRFVKLGFKLGFGGVCTFKNARKVVETIKQIDAKDILLETDAPYLSPEPFRGQLNEPKRTNIVLEKIAELKNLDVKFLEEQIYLNTLEVFKRYKNNTEI